MENTGTAAADTQHTEIDKQIMARRKAHYNCAAATLCGIMAALGKDMGEERLKNISAGFAGGIGKTHDDGPCGAIAGGVLALGLLSDGDDSKTARHAAELFKDFKEKLGAAQCRELKQAGNAIPCDLCCLTAGRKVAEMASRGETSPTA